MRRYELMLVVRPDIPDDKVQTTLDRVTRSITGSNGQIVKVSPWGRRRLAYPIGPHREGSYYIVIFDAPAEAVAELERNLHITEESLRHLVTRIERPAARRAAGDGEADADGETTAEGSLGAPPDDDEDVDVDDALIDESESEAAPAAID
jgi:small subunit ribosomal protein S6